VNSLREQKMSISNKQNEQYVASCDRITQTFKEPGPCGNQLTRLAEHGPEAADQNPIEGLRKLQPQQAVRFQKESAVQLAPSECEEPRLPDTKHIRNSHDAKQVSVLAHHAPPFLQDSCGDDDTFHGSVHAPNWWHHPSSRNLPSKNATKVHSKEEPTASKPASVQGIVQNPNA
jgi:hypothetical protein